MRVLVLRHVPHEHLGTLEDTFREKDIAFDYVNFYENPGQNISLENSGGLIILGGPMNVYETDKHSFLTTEDNLIKEAVDRQMPVLGICLGAQLIAKALGARVTKNKEKEIGWYTLRSGEDAKEDRLFKHFKPEETVFHWHGDAFEIPEGAVHLAESQLCRNQAFRYRENVYALQFHIEVNAPMVSEWLGVPENRDEIRSLSGKIDPDAIRKETPACIVRLNELAENVFDEFCGLIMKEK